jgi:ATP synthase protein I
VLTDDKRVVPMTLLAQAGSSLALAAVLWAWRGEIVAISAAVGGLIAVIPNAFLAARLLRPRGVGAAGLMRSAWVGEIGKMALTVVLFGVVFAYVRPLSPAGVLGGFISAQLTVVGALLWGGRGGTRAEMRLTKS